MAIFEKLAKFIYRMDLFKSGNSQGSADSLLGIPGPRKSTSMRKPAFLYSETISSAFSLNSSDSGLLLVIQRIDFVLKVDGLAKLTVYF